MEKTFQRDAGDYYPRKVFANQLITVEDLNEFRKQLLQDLLTTLKTSGGITPKKWMRAHEVRRMLKISTGTLPTLKADGVISYTKMGGVHLFDYDEIQQLLAAGKINSVARRYGK
jgi:hypothetical protein